MHKETPSSPVFKVLPANTEVARASMGPLQWDDSFRNGEPGIPFGWFTYYLAEDKRDHPDMSAFFEEKLANYSEARDERGNNLYRHTTIHSYRTRREVKLFDMADVKTHHFLYNRVSEEGKESLLRSFPLHRENRKERVMRASNLQSDRRLVQSMIDADLLHGEVAGWCHDDMEMQQGGVHAREGVVVDPIRLFFEDESYHPSNPSTPKKSSKGS